MIQPLAQGVILWPALQEDTKSGFPVRIHSFSEQEKLAAYLCQMFATNDLHWEFIG